MDRQCLVIRLELELADDSLTGRAVDGAGATREFAGWMGLVAAIDVLVHRRSPAPGREDSTRPADEGDAA